MRSKKEEAIEDAIKRARAEYSKNVFQKGFLKPRRLNAQPTALKTPKTKIHFSGYCLTRKPAGLTRKIKGDCREFSDKREWVCNFRIEG